MLNFKLWVGRSGPFGLPLYSQSQSQSMACNWHPIYVEWMNFYSYISFIKVKILMLEIIKRQVFLYIASGHIITLITSAKILCTKKVAFTGFKDLMWIYFEVAISQTTTPTFKLFFTNQPQSEMVTWSCHPLLLSA